MDEDYNVVEKRAIRMWEESDGYRNTSPFLFNPGGTFCVYWMEDDLMTLDIESEELRAVCTWKREEREHYPQPVAISGNDTTLIFHNVYSDGEKHGERAPGGGFIDLATGEITQRSAGDPALGSPVPGMDLTFLSYAGGSSTVLEMLHYPTGERTEIDLLESFAGIGVDLEQEADFSLTLSEYTPVLCIVVWSETPCIYYYNLETGQPRVMEEDSDLDYFGLWSLTLSPGGSHTAAVDDHTTEGESEFLVQCYSYTPPV